MYYVNYVSGCEPKLKSFDTKVEAMRFVANFKLKYQFSEDHWIELVFLGKVIFSNSGVSNV